MLWLLYHGEFLRRTSAHEHSHLHYKSISIVRIRSPSEAYTCQSISDLSPARSVALAASCTRSVLTTNNRSSSGEK